MDTQDIVSELYALRAGLSLIAKEKDMCDKEILDAEQKRDAEVGEAERKKDIVISKAKFQKDDEIAAAENEKNTKIGVAERQKKDVTRSLKFLEWRERDYADNEQEIAQTKYAKKRFKRGLVLKPLISIFFICAVLAYIASAGVLIASRFTAIPSLVNITIIITCVTLSIGIISTISLIVCEGWDVEIIWVPILYIINALGLGALIWFIYKDYMLHPLVIIAFMLIVVLTLVCSGITIWISLQVIPGVNLWQYKIDMKKHNEAVQKRDELKNKLREAEREYETAKKNYSENDIVQITRAAQSECSQTIANANMHYDMVCATVVKEYNSVCEKAEHEFSATAETLKKLHGKISAEIWETLVDTYGKLLDSRDWKILDLVIWQLETGRAETVKEALQLADRETQTDRIVNTLHSASMAIAQRIDDGFGNLQTQLNKNFYVLAQTLATAASRISYGIESGYGKLAGKIEQSYGVLAEKIDDNAKATSDLYESMAGTDRSLEKLFSEASLQTALLEKSNKSSGELMEAVKRLREG